MILTDEEILEALSTVWLDKGLGWKANYGYATVGDRAIAKAQLQKVLTEIKKNILTANREGIYYELWEFARNLQKEVE